MKPAPPDSVQDSVVVELPARPEFAATLRLLVASFGADVGFSVDEIDDLRLALNELFTSTADAGADRLEVTFAIGDRAITARMSSPRPIELDELALTIIRSVTDEFALEGATATIRKSATDGR